MDIAQELMNFRFRSIDVPVTDLFPKFNIGASQLLPSIDADIRQLQPHTAILETIKALGKDNNAGYRRALETFGFHDKKYETFSGHCHQSTPVLGLALKLLEYNVEYLECYRVDPTAVIDGKLVKMNPKKEANPANLAEFCAIDRIPYCCLEIKIKDEPFLISPKHVKVEGDTVKALLTTECYRPVAAAEKHHEVPAMSGIYLQPYVPRAPRQFNPEKQPVWMKQKDPARGEKPEELEFFATYLRIKLI